ncbi:dermonecrotic toxin domain-containing protein, partial [Pseudomonas viridiflava]|uniref:dermonecrotic toxin domain-containing protein n=1 Tax=Pseudomonas viridiflava TaxID=33069 RepID=UPI003BF5A750
MLYIPGDSHPFHRFAGQRELFDWLKARFAAAGTRSEMRSHFIRPSAEQASGAAFDRCINGLRAHDGQTGRADQSTRSGHPRRSFRNTARHCERRNDR